MMRIYRLFMRQLFLMGIFFGCGLFLNASHLLTGDITYQCIGNDNYVVTVTLYRDCSGMSAPTSVMLNASSSSCASTFVHTMMPDGAPVEVSQVCPSQYSSTTCSGGSLMGYTKIIYSDTIQLPAQCDDWVLSYSQCCRNPAITNLQNPGSSDLYMEVLLNNSNGICNNSVNYSSIPIHQTCVGSGVSYNHGTYDIDGDSLVFSAIPSKGNATSDIVYAAGLSVSDPIQGTTTFNDIGYNGVCGTYDFVLNAVQLSIVTMKVDEWRCVNGMQTLVGSSIRDLCLIGESCTNYSPSVWGVSKGLNLYGYGSDSANYYAQAGDSISLNTYFWDTDSSGNTTITSNHNESMPGSFVSYAPSGNDPKKWAYFSWNIPSNAKGHYLLTFKGEDDNCPVRAYTYHSLFIHVEDSNAASCTQVVSIQDFLSNSESFFKVYPNPSKGVLIVESSYSKDLELRVSDLLGRKVLEKVLLANGEHKIDFDGRKGLFMVEFFNGNKLVSKYKVLNE